MKRLLETIVAFLLLISSCGAADLLPSDITYLGAYRAPTLNKDGISTSYGFDSFAYADNLCYGLGNKENRAFTFTLPDIPPVHPRNGYNALPVGKVVTTWGNTLGPLGSRALHNSDWNLIVKDLYVKGPDVFVTTWHTYNTANRNYLQIGRSPISLRGTSAHRDPPAHYGDFNGLWRFTDNEGRWIRSEAIAGWMSPIPEDLSFAYFGGKDTLIGNSLSWRAGASNGPSAYAFDLDDLKSNGTWKPWAGKIECIHNLSYVHDHGVDGPSFWTGCNNVAGGLVVRSGNRAALLHFGRQGDPDKRRTYKKRWSFIWQFGFETIIAPDGNQGYRADYNPTDAEIAATTQFSTYDEAFEHWKTIRPSKNEVYEKFGGDGANLGLKFNYLKSFQFMPQPSLPYQNRIWFYRLDGATNREPYLQLDITADTYKHGYRELTAVAWDAERRRIYVSQANWSRSAVIHVWQVGGSEPQDQVINVPFTQTEYDNVEYEAEALELSIEEYSRRKILEED